MKIRHHSEPGGHAHNEDALEIQPLVDGSGYLLAIADGQGGRAGGGEAARLACATCVHAAMALPTRTLLQPSTWSELLARADEAVSREDRAGFTTLVACCVQVGQVCGASNGDSALLLVNAGGAHELTGQQAKDPPIGCGGAHIVAFAARLEVPWTLLAMTDGVWKYVGWEVLAQLVWQEQGEELMATLRRRAALPRTGALQDDFSAILIEQR